MPRRPASSRGQSPWPAARATENGRFRERCAALLIDTALVWAGVTACEQALARAGVYIQFELSFAIAAASYASACITWKGSTIGKALCGLAVRTADGARPGLVRALARETLGKILSAVPFLLGFFWVGVDREQRAWHDALTRTRVIRCPGGRRRARAARLASLLAAGLLAGFHMGRMLELYLEVRPMLTGAPAASASPRAHEDRSPSLLEASTISAAEEEAFVDWLDLHAQAPLDYTVEKSREHRVVIFGETHWQKEPLQFLDRLIPALVADAGVTCVAMEACLASDNPALERLVTGREYDRELAMEIARHHSSGSWGWKGYQDVFETVWRLNRAIPPGEPKVRVVGLDLEIDLPSVALAGIGDNAVDGSPLERLRWVRVAWQLPRLLLRDAFMARQVEKEILEKNERGIVWVGFAHSTLDIPNPGPRGSARGRMGFMLHRKYAASIYQIRVHDVDLPVTLSAPSYDGPEASMAALIERIMAARAHAAVAFDSAGSPFELLRDSAAWDYHFDPRSSFGSVNRGYLYLAPGRDLTRCDWLPGYVTREMFVGNRPYYQALARGVGADARNAEEADRVLRRR